MSTYAAELTTIKRLALQTLFTILQTATDPAELRRTATAILRIPDPQNPRGNAGATEATTQPSTPEPANHPTASTPRAPEPEELIVSSRGVERGSASDTPGNASENETHPDGVLVAPVLHTPTNAHPPATSAPHHPRPAAPAGSSPAG